MRYLTSLVVLPVLSIIPSVSAQSVRVTGIPQLDCPVVVEQQENGRDGSLTTADFKNFSEKTVDSIRIGWIVGADESAKPSEAALGMSTKLRPGLTPRGRVTVSAAELGLAPGTRGRLKFYVASGHFTDGSTFVCSAKTMRKAPATDGHVVTVHALR
ncbi:MAG TPA: hypothetical protein VMP12_11625 [Candidatus Sulfotelmatobacter sp.]|nr:hypothetical protein [Candidatus Sulfotelmatobacter sp.]